MNNKKKFSNEYIFLWALGVIILMAAALRLYRLDQVPPGVNRDEASIGYTAYSLLKTGKDEYGRPYPISFQSFGDYKLPLYIYSTMPFVKFFGLNELSVRLPSALAGILTVLLAYFLVRELFNTYLPAGKVRYLSLITSALLAISPWHLHLSRVESESNIAVFLVTTAVLLFLKGLKGKPLWVSLSFVLFALTYYTYHGNHIFTTLLLIGLILIYRSEIPRTKIVLIGFLIFLLLTSYIGSQTFFSADKTKISGISIFADPSIVHEKIELPRLKYANPGSLLVRLRYNRVTYAITRFTTNYLASFGPQFLFLKGGTNHAHNIQGMGNLYLVEAPLFYLGILFLFLNRRRKQLRFLLLWLLVSPIASSLTKDAPHTNRMFAVFPLPPLLTALGIYMTATRIHTKKIVRWAAGGIISLLILINLGIYLKRYYLHFPKNEAQYWGQGYKQLNSLLSTDNFLGRDIIMTKPEYSPYIFLLFYSGYDPLSYQTTSVHYPPTADQFVHVARFDRFQFREINWDSDLQLSNTLLVEYSKDVPLRVKSGFHKQTEILLPNYQSFLAVIETNP